MFGLIYERNQRKAAEATRLLNEARRHREEAAQLEGRVVDWIARELDRVKDDTGRVSVEDANRIAVEVGNRTIPIMGGL